MGIHNSEKMNNHKNDEIINNRMSITSSIASSITSSTLSKYERREMERAIQNQVQLAEQWTTCRKKLYLVNEWQKRILHKHKRVSTIVPNGYQPIPVCVHTSSTSN